MAPEVYRHDIYMPDENGQLEFIETVYAPYPDPDRMRRIIMVTDGYPEAVVLKCRHLWSGNHPHEGMVITRGDKIAALVVTVFAVLVFIFIWWTYRTH